ncbi:MAG TPA: long-chain-fatty-acid--CoA ligase [Bryobacteraceae bacterium]|nr:long-chain-fatty-acid--CoA ligase [Bryobacteraceae bacterium]
MKVPLTPLRCLHRAIDLYGHKEGVVCGGKRFTYTEFGERCERLASALARAGVRQEDRVAYLSFNTHQLLEGYFGAPQARAMLMPLNVRLTPPELGQILQHSEPRILFYESGFAPLLDELRRTWPAMSTINLDSEYEDFLANGRPERADIFTYDEDSIAELFYTSGSTGAPKGVMLSHRTLYMHAMAVAAVFAHDDTAVELHTIPLFHANGWGRAQTSAMMGIKQVMLRRFDPATVCRLIQEEKATSMSLVPTMANALLMFNELSAYELSSMKHISIGGAAASPVLIARMENAFHCQVLSGYGLTETSPVASFARPKSTVTYGDEEDRHRRQAMAGWPLAGTEIRVVDADMRDVPRDMTTIGEIVICGDNVMDGYFKDPAGTQAVMSGAWFHSGDMAVWDKEGWIQIVDRKKDIIISGGENISSIEVEHVLASHPSVAEAAVVGAPDPVWGEIPVAFVVVKPGSYCDQEQLAAFAEQKLAKFKLPRKYKFQSEPLPKGGTGKVLKRELREQFWEGKERRVQG